MGAQKGLKNSKNLVYFKPLNLKNLKKKSKIFDFFQIFINLAEILTHQSSLLKMVLILHQNFQYLGIGL